MCNKRNIFLEKSYTKCGRETSHSLFFKKSKLSISQNQQPEFSYSLFLFYVQVKDCHNIMKLRCSAFAFTSYKAFLKNKNSLSASFFGMIFEEKHFSPYILLTDQISLPDCLYFLRYLATYVLYKTSEQKFKYLKTEKSF